MEKVARRSMRVSYGCIPRYLTDSESQRLEAYVLMRDTPPEPRLGLENACFFVLAHMGQRARECVDLQVQDFELPA